MITCGRVPDFTDLSPTELVPTAEAASYIHPMADTLAGVNQAPACLVDDGSTGTPDRPIQIFLPANPAVSTDAAP